jgi:tetratricopeptide (TPR) repeat protein/GTPase SAR1 family protein
MEKVFISYSQESTEHSDRVLALANRLINDGLDCALDRYESSPAEGWPKWMDRQLKDAEYVVIVCTETYWNRVMDEEYPGKGKGVKWESTLTFQHIYENDSKNPRFIPVVFDPSDCRYIPTPLKGASFYCVDTPGGYEKLYRRLTKQPEVVKPVPGPIKVLPPKKPAMDFPGAAPGQAPGVSLYKLPVTGDRLFGREKEMALLEEAWNDAQTRIVCLVAWGGVGKTALVNRWLNEMQKKDYGGAQKVFGWSFYSQGAAEGKQASADEFFQETLEWFGDAQPGSGTAVDKGRRLARLAGGQKSLVILDGLEPLQYPPGEVTGQEGKLKDAGLAAFLKELAAGQPGHPGLCVITTRVPVTDLMTRMGFAVKEIPLEHLSDAAGKELLKSLGVTTGSGKDYQAAVKEYDGHALALTLLGHYIKSVHRGDIRRRDEIPRLSEGKIREGRHAGRVMEAYEKWFGPSPERDILYLLGLFDRPVEKGTIEVLKKEPAIPGVTERLRGLTEEDMQWALRHLREARLVAEENPQKPGTLDCHPLVREYFGEKLSRENPGGWQASHERLYRYFKDLPVKELPDTLEEMEPLFAAVAHGCRAGLHNEARFEVFWKRIRRGNEAYTVKKLGAFGSDLACLSHFFAVPWVQPAPGLPEREKAVVLSWAAFGLRAMGRLREAVQPMKAGLESHIIQKNWKESALDASNLSELLLTLGDVHEAVEAARQSVSHADRSGDVDWKSYSRATLADALHQSGQLKEAEKWFREAEALQKKRQPRFPFLYSLRGYRFCDHLLGQGHYQEVLERAEKFFEWRLPSDSLLDISLDNLTAGRAWMMSALEKKPIETPPRSEKMSRAMTFLEEAVEGLRKAGAQEFLAHGLIIRAEGYRHMKDYAKAQDDLAEALDIAELGGMKLFICDYHLEAGRLCQAQGKEEEAGEHLRVAKELVEETGYFRRGSEALRAGF